MEKFVSTSTADVQNEGWSFEKNVFGSMFTVEELYDVLKVVAKFREKYPNDDYVQSFEEIVRDEICNIFGGHIDENDEIYG